MVQDFWLASDLKSDFALLAGAAALALQGGVPCQRESCSWVGSPSVTDLCCFVSPAVALQSVHSGGVLLVDAWEVGYDMAVIACVIHCATQLRVVTACWRSFCYYGPCLCSRCVCYSAAGTYLHRQCGWPSWGVIYFPLLPLHDLYCGVLVFTLQHVACWRH